MSLPYLRPRASLFSQHPPLVLLSKTGLSYSRALHTQRSFKTLPLRSKLLQQSSRHTVPPLRLYSTVLIHDKPRSRLRRTISFFIIATTTFSLSAYFALTYAPPFLHPSVVALTSSSKMGSHIPTDEETLTMYTAPDTLSAEIDEHITQHALSQQLRADPSWKESRPHLRIPDAIKNHNLTAGTLSGPGMLTVPPLYFNKHDGSEMVQIFYVGDSVSGHPGIVHGGFLATMLDEGLARCAFPAMQNKVGVTANLNINYRRPTMAGQFLVLRAKTTKVEGRKAWAEGWIESLEDAEEEGITNGEVVEGVREKAKLVEASALFVEPKHAKVRTTGGVSDEMLAMVGLARSKTESEPERR